MANKIELFLIDEDDDYLDRVSMYILKKKNMFNLHIFSDAENIESALRENTSRIDILAVSEKMNGKIADTIDASVRLLLCDTSEKDPSGNFIRINKFQKTENLVNDLLQAFEKSTGKTGRIADESGQTKITGVYSPCGGSGKTTLALLISRAFKELGKKTMYLNFEKITSLKKNDNQGKSLSNVFLALQIKGSNLGDHIKNNILEDAYSGIYYFASPESTLEWNEAGENAEKLIVETLINMRLFDVIVMDFESELNRKNLSLLNYCGHILTPYTSEDSSYRKVNALKEELELHSAEYSSLSHKINYVNNKAVQGRGNVVFYDEAYTKIDRCMKDAPIPPVLTELAKEWSKE
jgi:cellulose biosynthesis protein BcsQ